MRGRVLLQAARVQVMSRRGKAVSNWKRPSMDEYGVPTEAWEQANARNHRKNNLFLAAGIVVFSATCFVAKASGHFYGNTTPYHLLTNEKN